MNQSLTHTNPHFSKGFTLLELLVAMAIFGLVGALGFGGLNAVITQQQIATQRIEELSQLQRGIRILTGDLSQPHPRFVREVLGQTYEGPLIADGLRDYELAITRAGWRNPAGMPRGELQRVQYRLEEGELIREYWAVVDRVLGTEPRSEVLLEGVIELEFGFLDGSGEWQQRWPAANQSGAIPAALPRAIRIRLELEDWGAIQRVVEVAR